jgi:hypothetical protein
VRGFLLRRLAGASAGELEQLRPACGSRAALERLAAGIGRPLQSFAAVQLCAWAYRAPIALHDTTPPYSPPQIIPPPTTHSGGETTFFVPFNASNASNASYASNASNAFK